jgi:hypothetical protein
MMDDNKVAVLLEDLRAQFRTFGEGLTLLNEKMDKQSIKLNEVKKEVVDFKHEFIDMKEQNRQEHLMLKQMIQDISIDQAGIKKKVNELDQEFEIKLRRIK